MFIKNRDFFSEENIEFFLFSKSF